MVGPCYNRRYLYGKIEQIRQESLSYHLTLYIAKFSPLGWKHCDQKSVDSKKYQINYFRNESKW